MRSFTLGNLISIALLLFSVSLQAQFSVSATLRPRAEYRHGYQQMPDSGQAPAFFVSNRVRLSGAYNTEKLKMVITLQEIRVWGNQQLKAESPTLNLFEGYADIKLVDSLRLQIGRQVFSYENERLLAQNDWRQSSQAHDALLLKWQINGWKLHYGTAFNQQREKLFNTWYDNTDPAIAGNYKTLNFLWVNKNFGKLSTTVMGIADGLPIDSSNTMRHRFTYGTSLSYNLSSLTFLGNAYLQSGKDQANRNISSYYLNGEVIYRATDKLTINPGLDILSGHDFSKSGSDYKAFSTLYGAGHKFNGHMDYFTNVYNQLKGAGLMDVNLKLAYKITSKANVIANYHYFKTQSSYIETGTIDNYLASEIDLGCRINFAPDINLQFGYSFLLPQKSLERFVDGDSERYADWAWVMVTINPTFFVSR